MENNNEFPIAQSDSGEFSVGADPYFKDAVSQGSRVKVSLWGRVVQWWKGV